MFGLSALQRAANPHSTFDKIIFLIDNVFTRAHEMTTIISFTALLALVVLRLFKNGFKKYWWIYRLPEVFLVVVVATGEACSMLHSY